MSISYPLAMPSTPGIRSAKLRAQNLVGLSTSPFTRQMQVVQWPGEWWEMDVSLPPMPRSSAEAWVAWLCALRGQVGSFLIGDPMGKTPQGTALGTPVTTGAASGGVAGVALGSDVLTIYTGLLGGFLPPLGIGDQVTFGTIATASFLTGQTVTVTNVAFGLHGPSFTANFTHADYSYATDSGSWTQVNTPNLSGAITLHTSGWTASQTKVLAAGDYIQIGSGATQRLYKNVSDMGADSSGNAAFDIWPALRETLSSGTSIVTASAAGCFRLAGNQREWSVDYTRKYGIDFKAIEAI